MWQGRETASSCCHVNFKSRITGTDIDLVHQGRVALPPQHLKSDEPPLVPAYLLKPQSAWNTWMIRNGVWHATQCLMLRIKTSTSDSYCT